MLGLGNHHGGRDKAILSSHPISGPPESRPIITNHIGLHPWSFALCVIAFDLIMEETYGCLPFHHRCVCIFCVRIKHPSGEVKWIEWIFCESGVIQTSGDVYVFWFRSICFWVHLTFIRLSKVSTTFWPIETHVIESRTIENLCFPCTQPSAGALGMGTAITWPHTYKLCGHVSGVCLSGLYGADYSLARVN